MTVLHEELARGTMTYTTVEGSPMVGMRRNITGVPKNYLNFFHYFSSYANTKMLIYGGFLSFCIGHGIVSNLSSAFCPHCEKHIYPEK